MIILKDLREKYGYTQAYVAEKLGVTQATYSNWENEVTEMSYSQLINAAKLFNVTVDFLLGIYKNDIDAAKYAVPVPVLAISKINKTESILTQRGCEYISKKVKRDNEVFGVKIFDNSMAPEILKNDILIIRVQKRYSSGDWIVIIDNNSFIIKRIYINNYGFIISDFSADSEPMLIAKKEFKKRKMKIVGKVIEVRRKKLKE